MLGGGVTRASRACSLSFRLFSFSQLDCIPPFLAASFFLYSIVFPFLTALICSYCFVIFMSFAVSVVGAVMPSRSIMARSISETLKG
jgi:hypothetical protein